MSTIPVYRNVQIAYRDARRKHGPFIKDNLLALAVLSEEFGEAAKEVLENNTELLKAELYQVAAVVVSWLEVLENF